MDWNLFWTAFGAIGTTLGAIATSIAVIVALWQTKIAYKKSIKIEFCDNATALNGIKNIPVVTYTIRNTGNRDVVLQRLILFIGKESHIEIFPQLLELRPIAFPYELRVENSETIMQKRENFINFIQQLVEDEPKAKNHRIKIVFIDSTGREYCLKTQRTPSYYEKSINTKRKEAPNNAH